MSAKSRDRSDAVDSRQTPDARSLLGQVRDEFRSMSLLGEGYFIRMRLSPKALRLPDGGYDEAITKQITESIVEHREIAMEGMWSELDNETYETEIVVNQAGRKTRFYDAFEDLANSVVRCLVKLPKLAHTFQINERDLRECGGWDLWWLGQLMEIGLSGSHPIIHATDGRFKHSFNGEQGVCYEFAGDLVFFKEPSLETIKRLKKAARAPSSCQQLRCGILRASAYAIDAILMSTARSQAPHPKVSRH